MWYIMRYWSRIAASEVSLHRPVRKERGDFGKGIHRGDRTHRVQARAESIVGGIGIGGVRIVSTAWIRV